MKPFRWLILLFILGTAVLMMIRPRKGEMPDPAPTELNPTPAAGSQNSATAARAVARQLGGPSRDAQNDIHHLQVTVQDEQGKPLDGAAVRATIRVEQGSAPLPDFNRTFMTVLSGMADVPWPEEAFEQLELVISKDDYASRRVVWDVKFGDDIPSSFVVKLKGGVQVGGYVVDPEGKPVAEATVSLSRFWRGGEVRPNKGEEPTFVTQKHVTGADGHWTARSLPTELLQRISIAASHTNFIGVQVSMDGRAEIEPELRAGTHRLQLKRGLEVRGLVINEREQPIADAQVWVGRKSSRERQQTKSDEQGRFIFRNINEGKGDFSALAEGYAPAAKSHSVEAGAPELVFKLAKGGVIRGIVQDEFNLPIEGVRVVLEGLSGEESYDRFEFSTTTDSAGKFAWTSAPNSPMPFYIGKSGYEQKRDVRLKPGEENVITLRQNRLVQGQVLDAETGKPVTTFTIAVGRAFGELQFNAGSGSTKQFKNEQGVFTIEVHEENENGIQATANDYAEQTQILPRAEDGLVKVAFKLKPGRALSVVVKAPDGQPVVGASVALVDGNPRGRTVQFARGRLRSSNSRTKLVTTDAAGRFEIPSPPEAGTIVAANGAGFGSATVAELQASGVLTLQAFGRIEGVLVLSTGASAGQELMLFAPAAGIEFDFESTLQTTDAAGRFAFDSLPSGKLSIARLVKISPESRAFSHRTEVMVAPGQTTRITLGGTAAKPHGQ